MRVTSLAANLDLGPGPRKVTGAEPPDGGPPPAGATEARRPARAPYRSAKRASSARHPLSRARFHSYQARCRRAPSCA